jgi:hypothetical protein
MAIDKRLVLATVAPSSLLSPLPSANVTNGVYFIAGIVDSNGHQVPLITLGKYNLDSLQTNETSVWMDNTHKRKRLVISVVADGRVRVVRIHDHSNQLTRLPSSNDSTSSSSSLSSIASTSTPTTGFGVSLNLSGVGLSIVMTCGARGSGSHRRPEELLYISAKDLLVTGHHHDGHMIGIDVKLARFQIDNQLHGTPFPVLLRGDPYALRAACLDETAASNNIDTVNDVTMNGSNNVGNTDGIRDRKARRVPVTSFLGHSYLHLHIEGDLAGSRDGFFSVPLFQLAVQRTEINFEEVVLTHLYHFARSLALADPTAKPLSSLNSTTDIMSLGSGVGQPTFMLDRQPIFYFHHINIEPVNLALSYSGDTGYHGRRGHTHGHGNNKNGHNSSLPFLWWLARLGISLMSTEDVRLSVAAFDSRDMFGSMGVIREALISHFTSGWLGLLPRLLASADMVGNPMFLVNAMGRGVKDFISAPLRGLRTGSPLAFISGIGEGSQSLVQHTIYGCANTAARMLSSTAKVLTQVAITNDSMIDHDNTITIRSGLHVGALTFVKESRRGLRGALHGAIAFAALPGNLLRSHLLQGGN